MQERLSEQSLNSRHEYQNHVQVVRIDDPAVSLRGFIAIHRDHGKGAIGGTRMHPYTSEEAALEDALRLSSAMTYKCAISGLPYGGGKGVIIGDPDRDKSEQMLRAYARAVGALSIPFFTGEDVGLSESDVQIMAKESPFFIGKSDRAGDPSPFAALSTFLAIKAACLHRFGSDDLSARAVAVKGVGKVGSELVRLLVEAGVKDIRIADVKPSAVFSISSRFPNVSVVSASDIHKENVDIFSPCAMGNECTEATVPKFSCGIICGGANNQLASPRMGDELYARGISYIPDFLANAGGLIDVADELEKGGYRRERVMERISGLPRRLEEILSDSDRRGVPPYRIAEEYAHAFIA